MIVHFLAISLLVLNINTPAFAAMISTDQLASEVQIDSQRVELTNLLARSDVRAQLVDLGVDVTAAQSRVDTMTSAELTKVSGLLDSLPAGSGGAGLVLTVLLILVILELVGAINIFPRI